MEDSWYVSIHLCPTKSRDSSAIYKLSIRVADYENLKGMVSKKFSISEVLIFRYDLHTVVEKIHRNSSNMLVH
jgi:hypothetical protein